MPGGSRTGTTETTCVTKKAGGAAQALRKLGPPRLATLTLAVYRH